MPTARLKLVGTATKYNVRKGPGTSYGVAKTLPKGSYVKVTHKIENEGRWWFKIADNEWISGNVVEGWLQDDGKWWYVTMSYTYPKNQIKEIDGKEYIFDKDGWMVTSDRIDPSGFIVY